jgi:hypothetical protein
MRRAARLGGAAIACLSLHGCGGAEHAKDLSACPRGAPPAYVVKTLLPEPEIDKTMTLAQIAERSHTDYRYLTLGASEGELIVIGVLSSRVAPSAAGGSCAYPKEVSLMLALGKRVIHIAREFDGTEPCVYGEVLGHERRHVALDDQLLRDESTALPAQLPARFADLDGVWGGDDAAARAALQQRLKADADALKTDLQEKRRAAHAKEIDTVEERRRLAHACQGRLKQLYPEFD